MHGTRWHGVDATCTNDGSFDTSATLFFHNNLVDGNAGKEGFSGVFLKQSGNGTLHFSAKNNIITNNGFYGINLDGGMLATEDISHNIILGHTNNTRGVQNLNPIREAPTYTDYDGDDFTMTSGSGIDAGVDLRDLYKTAIGASTRWDQDPLVVHTVDRNSDAPWDLGPYEFGDVTNPGDVPNPTMPNAPITLKILAD